MKIMKFAFSFIFCVALSTDAFRVFPYEIIKPQEAAKLVSRPLSALKDEVVSIIEMDKDKIHEKFKSPDFCHGLDCPAYKLLNKSENYELREYAASRWVSTELQKMKYEEASEVMFMRLFDYIEGKNSKKEKIAMTAPVIIHVVPGQGPACKSDFTMSFFMAPKEKNPPTPTASEVHLSSLPQQKVFVSSFSGRPGEKDWIEHGRELASALQKEGKKFDSSYFYTAGYDSPFRLLDRHNEIWFIAKN